MKVHPNTPSFMISHSLIPAILNGLLNGVLSIYAHPWEVEVKMWGQDAYGIDLVLTAFLIPAITWLIVCALIRKSVGESGSLSICLHGASRLANRLNASRTLGSISWGACGVLLFGLPTLVGLQLLGAPNMRGITYSIFKGVYSATISALLQPMMACTRIQFLRAMREKSL